MQKKERRKKTHSLTLSILNIKKTVFLVGLLINWCWQQTWCVHRASFQVRFLFSLPLPLSSSSWFDVGVLALLGFCSFFFASLQFSCSCTLSLYWHYFTLHSSFFYFFRFLQNAREWSEWTHLILFFCFFFLRSQIQWMWVEVKVLSEIIQSNTFLIQ